MYEQLLRTTPNDAELLQEYGKAKYFEYANLEDATRLFERAVNVDPDSIPALLWLGDLYALGYGKGYSAALSIYQRVLQLNPYIVDAYMGVGMLHRAPSSPVSLKDAIEAFHTAAQLEPQRPDTHVNLGMALIEDGDRQNACKELVIAEKLLAQSGEHRQARGIQAVRKKLEANQPVTSVAYSNLSPRYKG
jgi:tetratricopeptide (TPR) repeat protein